MVKPRFVIWRDEGPNGLDIPAIYQIRPYQVTDLMSQDINAEESASTWLIESLGTLTNYIEVLPLNFRFRNGLTFLDEADLKYSKTSGILISELQPMK